MSSLSRRKHFSMEWAFKKTLMNPGELDRFVVDLMVDLYYNRREVSRLTASATSAKVVVSNNRSCK